MRQAQILVVGGENSVADQLRNRLLELGYPGPEVVSSGDEALGKIFQSQPDLVLMDFSAGEVEGLKAGEALRDRFQIPVVYLATDGQAAALQGAKGAEPLGYVLRPFEGRELQMAIEMALYRRRMEKEHQQAEEALKEKEAFNFALFEYNPVETIVVDLAGGIVNFNLARRKGRGRLPRVGDLMYRDFAGSHTIDMRAELMACIESGRMKRFPEQTYRDKVLSITISPFVGGAIITSEDITERKRAEGALRESEEKYRTLVEHAGEAIFIAQDGVIKFSNPSTLSFGYSAEELARIPFGDLIHPEDREMVLERYRRRVEGEEAPSTYSFRFLKRSGEEVWAQLNVAPISWEGRPATLNFLRDITPLKKLEMQFQQAQKMEAIGTLAGGIAHDFNNLLMGIQGYISLMLLSPDSSHPHYENLKKIEEHVRNGASLTRQLLGFARRGKYEVKPSDINEILRRSSEMFERTRREIRISRKFQQDIWTVEVDRGQIEQALLNLYVNAWQAMPEGGDLYLETKNITLGPDYAKPFWVQPGNYVKISVTDTGVGMDERTQQRVFEPFFTTKEMGRGTGLGLASAYGIVKNHGGFINLYSEKGHGSTFNIYLPASEKVVKEAEKTFSEGIPRGTEVVLLVDDESTITDVIEKALTLIGYKVFLASDGTKALEVYRKNQDAIAVVILDMIMPGLSGGKTFDLLKEINPGVKVILASGYSADGEAAQIMARGCNGFIQKPFGIRELSQKIREILDKN